MEKRTYIRTEIQQDATLILNGERIVCRIQNTSRAGALIGVEINRINDPKKIEIGIDVEIIFKPDEPGIKGKILRLAHDGDTIFFAVYFLEHRQFE